MTIAELARAVVENTVPGTPVEIACKTAPGVPAARYVPSVERARTELGLEPLISLEEAIRRMYAWNRASAVSMTLVLHEVVADHVADDQVAVFDAPHVRLRDPNLQFGKWAELSAVASRQGDRFAPDELAYSMAETTFGELPDPLIAISTSPGCAKFLSCSVKTQS